MKLKKLAVLLLGLCLLFTACKKNHAAVSGGGAEDAAPAKKQTVWLPATCEYVSVSGIYVDTYSYDKKGNLVGFTSICSDVPAYTANFSYDENDLMIAEVHVWYEEEKVCKYRQSAYTYNEGVLSTKETTVETGGIFTTVCHYTTSGQPGQEQVFAGEELVSTSNYFYNDLDMLTKKTVTYTDGTVEHYAYQYAYDPNGHVGLMIYTLEGEELYRDSWVYLGNDKISETTRYYADNTYERHAYTYDDEGRISLDTWSRPDGLVVEKRYTYTSITATAERGEQLAAQREALLN